MGLRWWRWKMRLKMGPKTISNPRCESEECLGCIK
jgi:hypothetical protein